MADEEPGLRRIGNLIPKIEPTQPSEASTPPKSRKRSATSGTPRPVLVPASETGTQRGALGAARNLPAILAEPMAGSDPAKTDAALLASLRRLLGQSLDRSYRDRVDPVYGYDTELTGYSLLAPVSATALQEARELVAASLRPAPTPMIAEALTRLHLQTKSRQLASLDYEMQLVFLAEELAEFPPDVIRSALRKIARRETFFPSLAEMIDQCQREFRNRRLIAKAVGLED